MNRDKLIREIIDTWHYVHKDLIRSRAEKPNATPLSACIALDLATTVPELTVKKLAAEISVSSSAATQIIGELEKLGLVTKKQNLNDKRSSIISITKKGKERAASLDNEIVTHFHKLFQSLSDREIEKYVALTRKMAINNN